MARAALEASAITWWLHEPGIGAEQRAKRGLSEFLYSATEEAWLHLAPDAPAMVDEWVERAAKLGWAATDYNGRPWSTEQRGKPRVDGVGRPSTPAAITRLLGGDETSRVGNFQWSRLSAVPHVTWFGLRWALMLDDQATHTATGLRAVPMGTDSGAVSVQALCILRGLREAAAARLALMGWTNDEWQAASHRAEELEVPLLQAFRASTASAQ